MLFEPLVSASLQLANRAVMAPEWIRTNFPESYAKKDRQGIVNPDSIGETYWQIHVQPRDAGRMRLN